MTLYAVASITTKSTGIILTQDIEIPLTLKLRVFQADTLDDALKKVEELFADIPAADRIALQLLRVDPKTLKVLG